MPDSDSNSTTTRSRYAPQAIETWLVVEKSNTSAGGWRTPFDYRLTTKATLFLTVLGFFLLQVSVSIVLLVLDSYNMKMFTYWSFTILTAYYATLLAALILQHRLITAVIMFFLPVVLGLVLFVFVAIIVIVWNSATVYIDGTVCDTPAGDITMEQLYVGDKLIHAIPVVGMFFVMFSGLEFFSHRIFVLQVRRFSLLLKWLYFAYWMLAPVCIISLFQMIFNVEKTYSTGLPTWARLLIMGAITLCTQVYILSVLNSVSSYKQIHSHALPDLRRAERAATEATAGEAGPLVATSAADVLDL
jgi:hypothetical protein